MLGPHEGFVSCRDESQWTKQCSSLRSFLGQRWPPFAGWTCSEIKNYELYGELPNGRKTVTYQNGSTLHAVAFAASGIAGTSLPMGSLAVLLEIRRVFRIDYRLIPDWNIRKLSICWIWKLTFRNGSTNTVAGYYLCYKCPNSPPWT